MGDTTSSVHPPIATREEWLAARLELLEQEKAHTREYDRINARRRRLPMVKVEKSYVFEGASGEKTLPELFDGNTQLIVYHFMFGPDWEKGCPGCTGFVNSFGDLSPLASRSVNLVLVSRAPYAKLAAYQEQMGWTVQWYSSGGTDFNFDFGVTLDPSRGPVSYNYKSPEETLQRFVGNDGPEEMPGLSVFFRLGDDVFHTYSTFARGAESLTDAYPLLDVTPFGRQEDFEDSPAGWPQKPTYG